MTTQDIMQFWMLATCLMAFLKAQKAYLVDRQIMYGDARYLLLVDHRKTSMRLEVYSALDLLESSFSIDWLYEVVEGTSLNHNEGICAMLKATKIFLLSFLAVVAIIFILEYYLRTAFPLPWQDNPYLGTYHIPNMRVQYAGADPILNPEYQAQIEINSRGLRGPEYPFQPPDQVKRILVLGDSYTEAFQVPFQDTYVNVLQNELNKKGNSPQFEVINAGIGGVGTANELLLWRREGINYHPNLVVLQFFFNDISDNSLSMRPGTSAWWPYFTLEEGKPVLHNFPAEVPQPVWFQNYFPYRLSLFLSYRVREWPPLFNTLVKGLRIKPPLQHSVWIKSYTPQTEEAWQLTEALVEQLNQEVESTGAKLVVFILPAAQQIEPWAAALNRDAWPDYNWDFDLVDKTLCPNLQEKSIPCTSLARDFRNYQAEHHDQLYFTRDRHLYPAGQHLVGELLFQYLTMNGYVSTKPQNSP
ncbi:MAG: hypothetical protein HY326_04495 [Chloroflexi bacterium]|nr:hypothetical protein [Chloroflexota bacterium]